MNGRGTPARLARKYEQSETDGEGVRVGQELHGTDDICEGKRWGRASLLCASRGLVRWGARYQIRLPAASAVMLVVS